MAWMTFLQVHDSLVLRNVTKRTPLINADYKALELVIMADLCLRLFKDGQLAEAVKPGAQDIHAVNARMVYGELLGWKHPDGSPISKATIEAFAEDAHCKKLRYMIKTLWYKLQYGGNAYGCANIVGPDGQPIGEDGAETMIEAVMTAVPGLRKWQHWCENYVDEHGGIYSLDGRWCDLYEESAPDAPEWLIRRGYRRAYNFPLQATGAGIIGNAMVRVSKCKGLAHPDCPLDEAVRLLEHHMTSATANGVQLLVPLSVSIGTGESYYEA